MKENFANLTKEIDFQEVQEAQRVPKKLDPRKHTTRTETEPRKWRSHGGLSTGEWEGERRGRGTGNKKHKW